MATQQPLTGRLSDALMDMSQKARVLFEEDGVLSADEQEVLHDLREILWLAEDADDARRRAVHLLNTGEVTAWHARIEREKREMRMTA